MRDTDGGTPPPTPAEQAAAEAVELARRNYADTMSWYAKETDAAARLLDAAMRAQAMAALAARTEQSPPLAAEVEILPAPVAVLEPGDRVLVALHHRTTALEAGRLIRLLQERFPDVTFVLADGVTALAVQHPAGDERDERGR